MERLPEPLWKHFREPRNVGRLADADGEGRGENAACGDLLVVFVKLEGARVERALFQARACGAVIATASLVTESVRGLLLEDARRLDVEALLTEAGGLPPGRAHAARVVARALRGALAPRPT